MLLLPRFPLRLLLSFFNRLQQTTNILQMLNDDHGSFFLCNCTFLLSSAEIRDIPERSFAEDDFTRCCNTTWSQRTLKNIARKGEIIERIFLRLQVIDLLCLQYSHTFSISFSLLFFFVMIFISL